jgi:hypothetical protein
MSKLRMKTMISRCRTSTILTAGSLKEAPPTALYTPGKRYWASS